MKTRDALAVHHMWPLGFLCALIACLGPRGDTASFSVDGEELAARVETELASVMREGPLPRISVVDTVASTNGSPQFLRVWLAMDHGHPYVFAVGRHGIIPLGGFTAPHLEDFSSELPEQNPADRARLLARVADRHGAVKHHFPADGGPDLPEPEVMAAWQRERDRWPPDTQYVDAKDRTTIRLTMLSWDSRNYATAWYPTCYVFRFERSGALSFWSRSERPPLIP